MLDDDILRATRDAFMEEAAMMLKELEESLLSMTDDPSSETVNAAFRAAHTIKGSAGLFGFTRVVAFTHEVEALLDRMRSGKHTIDSASVNLLLACRDQIENLLHEVGSDADPAQNAAESARLLAELKAIMSSHAGAAAGAAPAAAGGAVASSATTAAVALTPTTRPSGAKPEWLIWFKFGQETFIDGFDPAAFLRYMLQIGEIAGVEVLAQDVPLLDVLDAEQCHLGFVVRLRTEADKETVESVFEFISDSITLRLLPSPYQPEQIRALLAEVDVEGAYLGETLVRIGALGASELELLLQPPVVEPEPNPVEDEEPSTVAAPVLAVASASAASKAAAAPAAREKKTEESRYIRVSADKLDNLISMIGELVIGVSAARTVADRRSDVEMQEVTERLEKLVEGARDHSLQLRMVQVGETFSRFKRIVHDVSRSLGKDVDLVITGGETELDKSMVEQIVDPLTHLVRNSLDHGMETPTDRVKAGKHPKGKIRLNAFHDAGAIVIEVGDDGRGLSRDKILGKAIEKGLITGDAYLTDSQVWELIFLPGFSTAEKVTDISGRGVGMDVVRRNIESLRGEVALFSTTGEGSCVQIRLPLTLAIIDGFLIDVAGAPFVFPLDGVEECIEVPPQGVGMKSSSCYFELRGQVIPLLDLRQHFRLGRSENENGRLVVVRHGNRRVGIRVDKLLGEHQTVIKPLGRLFRHMRCFSGSTILGSGAVALILDIGGLLSNAGSPPADAAVH